MATTATSSTRQAAVSGATNVGPGRARLGTSLTLRRAPAYLADPRPTPHHHRTLRRACGRVASADPLRLSRADRARGIERSAASRRPGAERDDATERHRHHRSAWPRRDSLDNTESGSDSDPGFRSASSDPGVHSLSGTKDDVLA